jgi:putative transposase
MQEFAATQRRAYELASIARSTFRYRANTAKDDELRQRLTRLAHEKPRYGYRRLAVLLRREGECVNHKRVFRVYRAAGLSVKRKKRKRLMRVGRPSFVATTPNQQWAIDFAHDRMVNGRTLRMLSIVENVHPRVSCPRSRYVSSEPKSHSSARPSYCTARQTRTHPDGHRERTDLATFSGVGN